MAVLEVLIVPLQVLVLGAEEFVRASVIVYPVGR